MQKGFSSEFVVKMIEVQETEFDGEQEAFTVLEFMPNGDLFDLMQTSQNFPEKICRRLFK